MAESYNELFGLGDHSQPADLFGWWQCQETTGSAAANRAGGEALNFVNGTFDANRVTGPGAWLPNAANLDGPSSRHFEIASDAGMSAAFAAHNCSILMFVHTAGASADASPTLGTVGKAALNNFQFRADIANGTTARTTRRTGSNYISGGTVWSHGVWHHVAQRASENYNSIILDGVEDAPNAQPATWYDAAGTGNIRFGRQLNRETADLDGDVAGLAIFSRMLTAAEVAEHRLGPEPLNVLPADIQGDPVVGETATCSTGYYDSDNGIVTITYQWWRADDGQGLNAAPIPGATSTSYLVPEEDEGKFLRVWCRGTNDGGFDVLEDTFGSWREVISGGETATPDNVDGATDITQPTVALSASADVDNVDAATDITQPSLSVSVSVAAEDVTSATDITQPTVDLAVSVAAENVTSTTDITQPSLSVSVSVSAENVTSATHITQPTAVTGSAALANNVTSATDITEPSLSVSVSVTAESLTSTTHITQPTAGLFTIADADNVDGATDITQPSVALGVSVVADSLEVLTPVDSPTWQVDVSVTAESLLGATFISDPFATDETKFIPGAESSVYPFRSHARVFAYRSHSRVQEEHDTMGIINCTVWTVGEGALDMGALDYTEWLDDPEELSGTPTVVELDSSDLTITDVTRNVGELVILGETVAPNHAVTFKFSGMQAGKNYKLRITADTSYGRTWPTEQLISCPT